MSDLLWKPFENEKDFVQKDTKINTAIINSSIMAITGYAVGFILFRSKSLRGFTSGAIATWTFRNSI